jgi:hypothetical protein
MDVLSFLSQISICGYTCCGNSNGVGYDTAYGSGDGSGKSKGNGGGNGTGVGYDSGRSNGYDSGGGTVGASYGVGPGKGSGYSTSRGTGYGGGYSPGPGYSIGCGSGDANGFLLKSIGGFPVTKIDGIYTHIRRVHSAQLASAYIFGDDDFTRRDTRVAIVNGYAAHGETAHKAVADASAKYFATINFDDRAEAFRAEFANLDAEYNASDFYRWHGILTGSCEQGRRLFAESHGIDIDNDKLTLRQFFEITANDYGADRLHEVRKLYKNA